MTNASLRMLYTTGPARLSDDEWSRVEHLFPAGRRTPGRPTADARQILDAVLWACFDEHKWQHLPASYPPQQTCYITFLKWRRSGLLTQVADTLGVPYEAFCALPPPGLITLGML
jgi:transposase